MIAPPPYGWRLADRAQLDIVDHIYRVSFYVIAVVAAVSAAAGMCGLTVWMCLMAPVAFVRGKLWL
jgi:hypothetical protein